MSFTKLSYDDCSYKANLSTNVSALSYTLDPVRYYRCNPCMMGVGVVGGNSVSIANGNLVDLESNLFGIDREASKCSSLKYLPQIEQASGADFYRPVCTNKVDTKLRHLPSCQMYSTPSTPWPPAVQSYTCPKR